MVGRSIYNWRSPLDHRYQFQRPLSRAGRGVFHRASPGRPVVVKDVVKHILRGVPGFMRRIVKPCAAGGHSDPDHDPDRDPDPDHDHDPDRDPDPDHDHDPDRDPDRDHDHDRDPDHDPDRDRDRDPDRDPDRDRDHDPDPDRDRDPDLSNPALSSAAFIFGSEAARP